MDRFVSVPFARIVFGLCFGFMVSFYSDFSLPGVTLVVCLIIILIAFVKGWKSVAAVGSMILIAILGFYRMDEASNNLGDIDLKRINSYKGKLVTQPTKKSSTKQMYIDISAVRVDDRWEPVNTKSVLYIGDSELVDSLHYGDEVLIMASLKFPTKPLNPGQFDFGDYLRKNGVYYTSYVEPEKIKVLASGQGNVIISLANEIRTKLLNTLNERVEDREVRQISQALLLGHREELSSDVRDKFTRSGTVHILAVSGLHVGIIYGLFFLILRGNENRRFRTALTLLAILSIWIYAGITGFSAPVQRASIMFTTLLVAGLIRRRSNVYNTIAVSAFIVLLINPHELFQVGFALSYAAVIGIVFFQPKIYGLVSSRYWLLDKCWELISVSLAAQILTTPLILYYFHTFPTYFLISNLVIVPLIPLIIYCGLAGLVVNSIPYISDVFWYACEALISVIHWLVSFVSALPKSQLTYRIDFPALILCLLMIGILMLVIKSRSKIWANWSVLLIILLASYMAFEQHYQNSRSLVIYSEKGVVLDVVHSGRIYRYANELDEGMKNYVLNPASSYFNANVQQVNLIRGGQQISVGQQTLAILGDSRDVSYLAGEAELVLIESGKKLFDDVEMSSLEGKTIIFGYGCTNRFKESIMTKVNKKASIHDLRQGAFILEI